MPLIQYSGGRGRPACSTEQVPKGTEKYCLPLNNNNHNNNNNYNNNNKTKQTALGVSVAML